MTDRAELLKKNPRRAITKAKDPSRALVEAIAMDIGKAVVHHIKTMYQEAFAHLPSSGLLSVRNCVFNEIIAAIEVSDEGQIIARLQDRKTHRRKLDRLRKAKSVDEIQRIMGTGK